MRFVLAVSLVVFMVACSGAPEPALNRSPTVTSLTASPSSGEAPLTVTLTAVAQDPDGDPMTYAWWFGDGHNTAGGSVITHTYLEPGSYTANVNVSDGRGGVGVRSTTIIVFEGPAVGATASFVAVPTTGTPPLTVSFDASASSSTEGAITSYDWAFGDGNTDSGVTTMNTYQTAGSFTARLTVTDEAGNSATTSRTITVGAITSPPVTPPPSPPPPAPSCCRYCSTGKPCGDSCIAAHLTCHRPPGCACWGPQSLNGDFEQAALLYEAPEFLSVSSCEFSSTVNQILDAYQLRQAITE